LNFNRYLINYTFVGVIEVVYDLIEIVVGKGFENVRLVTWALEYVLYQILHRVYQHLLILLFNHPIISYKQPYYLKQLYTLYNYIQD
jgi:hypothetical protein